MTAALVGLPSAPPGGPPALVRLRAAVRAEFAVDVYSPTPTTRCSAVVAAW